MIRGGCQGGGRGPTTSTGQQASCLYVGTVSHRRARPEREFHHPLAMVYVDLDELPDLLGGRFLRRWPGLLRFCRSDYHGDPRRGLGDAVRDTVERETGLRPGGPVRLLTNLRSLGHCFNPVSFYYCFGDPGADSGERLLAVLAEVTNTPWGERHAYVLQAGAGRFDKRLHVSPFMPMRQIYSCHAAPPAEHLSVSIESYEADQWEFRAALLMRRVELTPATVRRITARYPFATLRTVALIYGHALSLRLSGVRTHAHPNAGAT